jgi:hypothetical protein
MHLLAWHSLAGLSLIDLFADNRCEVPGNHHGHKDRLNRDISGSRKRYKRQPSMLNLVLDVQVMRVRTCLLIRKKALQRTVLLAS